MKKNKEFVNVVNKYFNNRWKPIDRINYVLLTSDEDGIIFYVYEFPLVRLNKTPTLISKWIMEHLEPFIKQYKIELPIIFSLSHIMI